MSQTVIAFRRPNVKFEVRPKAKGKVKPLDDLMKILGTVQLKNKSGIIYCLSRYECDNTAAHLQAHGIQAQSYHFGLAEFKREFLQREWLSNRLNILVATMSFGYDIEKSDVQFIIHYSLPNNIQGYCDQTHLAGRDGQLPAICTIFYSPQDITRMRILIRSEEKADRLRIRENTEKFYQMVAYCENRVKCRRVQLMEFYHENIVGGTLDPNHSTCQCGAGLTSPCDCDICTQTTQYEMVNVTADAMVIVDTVRILSNGRTTRPKDNFTLLHFVDVFKGSQNARITSCGHDNSKLHGRGKAWSRVDTEGLFQKLVIEGYLKEELIQLNLYYAEIEKTVPYLRIGPKVHHLLTEGIHLEFPIPIKKKAICGKKKVVVEVEEEPTTESSKEKKGRVKKIKKDENRPSRPVTAYLWFCQEERLAIKTEFPAMPPKQIMRELGARWKALAPEGKAKFKDLHERDQKRYEEEMKKYNDSIISQALQE